MNKFEQVSNLDHQMSVAGEGLECSNDPCLQGMGLEGGCTVRYNASWEMVTRDPPVNRQTGRNENITFPQLRWRAVMNDILREGSSASVINYMNKLYNASNLGTFLLQCSRKDQQRVLQTPQSVTQFGSGC